VGAQGDNFSTGAAWIYTRNIGVLSQQGPKLADSGDCGQVFRLIADTDSDRSRTAFR